MRAPFFVCPAQLALHVRMCLPSSPYRLFTASAWSLTRAGYHCRARRSDAAFCIIMQKPFDKILTKRNRQTARGGMPEHCPQRVSDTIPASQTVLSDAEEALRRRRQVDNASLQSPFRKPERYFRPSRKGPFATR